MNYEKVASKLVNYFIQCKQTVETSYYDDNLEIALYKHFYYITIDKPLNSPYKVTIAIVCHHQVGDWDFYTDKEGQDKKTFETQEEVIESLKPFFKSFKIIIDK